MSKSDLQAVIDEAGLGSRSAKRLLSARAKLAGETTTTSAKGHGAAELDSTTVDSI